MKARIGRIRSVDIYCVTMCILVKVRVPSCWQIGVLSESKIEAVVTVCIFVQGIQQIPHRHFFTLFDLMVT